MNIFINDVLSDIENVFNDISFDTLLHGKHENFISAAISARANSNLDPKGKIYYANQINDIDIVRIDNNQIKFCCECKYDYTSDLNNRFKTVNIESKKKGFEKLKQFNGLKIPHISYQLCYALEQIKQYQESLHQRVKQNRLVILNMVFAPHGTCGKTDKNSEIKIFDDKRINFDKETLKHTRLEIAPYYFEKKIRDLPVVRGLYPCLRCLFRHCTSLNSRYGFKYYIITLAFSE